MKISLIKNIFFFVNRCKFHSSTFRFYGYTSNRTPDGLANLNVRGCNNNKEIKKDPGYEEWNEIMRQGELTSNKKIMHDPGYEEWNEIMRQGELTPNKKIQHDPGYEEWIEIMRQSEYY